MSVYASTADRDTAIRRDLAAAGRPGTIVAGANWTVTLCDSHIADEVAKGMSGIVIASPPG